MVSFADAMFLQLDRSVTGQPVSPNSHPRILGHSKEIFLQIAKRSHGVLPLPLKEMMLVFGRDMLSEQLQKEALLYPFCQDFAVPNVIIHMAEQITNDANVKHKTHDVANKIVKCCTTCNLEHNEAFKESFFDFTVVEVEHRPPTLSNTRFID